MSILHLPRTRAFGANKFGVWRNTLTAQINQTTVGMTIQSLVGYYLSRYNAFRQIDEQKAHNDGIAVGHAVK